MAVLGVDIGGTGIKGAMVNTETGDLLTPRHRLLTPNESTPENVAQTFKDLVDHFGGDVIVGAGFPAVIRNGTVLTAANIDHKWIGTDAQQLFGKISDRSVYVVNDADAAGLAEMRFGAGVPFIQHGVVIMLTLGTGIGSAIFSNGQLLPNTELGHILIKGKDAEKRTSDAARQRKNLSWKAWGKLLDQYVQYLDSLFWPDIFIVGGGGVKYYDKFSRYLLTKDKVVPAQFLNQAGIVGAALYASGQTSTATTSSKNSAFGQTI